MRLECLDILQVWEALDGGKLRNKRGRAFWRGGDGYNITLDREKGAWFDFRDGRGGGVLELVMIAKECDKRSALTFLEIHSGLDPTRSLTALERRQYARTRQEATELAAWKERLLEALKRERIRWWEIYHVSLRYVLDHGLDSELGDVMATVHEIAEVTIGRLTIQVDVLAGARHIDLLPIFRERNRRHAA